MITFFIAMIAFLIGFLLGCSAVFIFSAKVFMLDKIKRLCRYGEGATAVLVLLVCGQLLFGVSLNDCCWQFCVLVLSCILQKMAADRLYSNLISWLVEHPFGMFIAEECDEDGIQYGWLSIEGRQMSAMTMCAENLPKGKGVPVGVYLSLNQRKDPEAIKVYSLGE